MKKIKVFSDFACPFCYIGFAIAKKLVLEDEEVDFSWYPYELDKNAPQEGSFLGDMVPAEQIEMAYRRIERLGSEYDLVYTNKTRKYNTALLHRAALYAASVGMFYEFADQSFKAIFEQGKNVAMAEVVNEIGLMVGLDITEMTRMIKEGCFEEQIRTASEMAQAYRIESVPSFIREDGKVITQLKKYEKFKEDLLD